MGLLARAVAQPLRLNVAFAEEFWPELIASRRSKSGQTVTIDKALGATAVLGWARVVPEDVAQVSRDVFRKLDDGGSEVAKDHPLRNLLVRRPNDWQTGFEFFEQLVLHCGLAGRFIAWKNIVRRQVRELIPFEPSCVRVEVGEYDQLRYFLKSPKTGEEREVPPAEIWHVKGPSWNGWDGLETMKLAREAIGLSLAAEESHALMHGNGGQTQGVFSVEGTLKDGQYRDLKKWIDDNAVGANRFKPLILDRGTKYLQTSMSGVDAQHLETRRFQIEEVCRALRVLPIMLGYSDKTATFASAQEMFAAHVKYTLGGWFRRIEESIGANLLSEEDWAKGIYFKFLPISLLRAAPKERGEFYWKLWQMGAVNPNEIRAWEELNPYPGGDQYRVPSNTLGVDEKPDEDDDTPPAPGQPPKTARRNVGRVLSGRNERRIRDADALLNDVLAELDKETEE